MNSFDPKAIAELEQRIDLFNAYVDSLADKYYLKVPVRKLFELHVNPRKYEGKVFLCFKSGVEIDGNLKEDIERYFNELFPWPDGLPPLLTVPCP